MPTLLRIDSSPLGPDASFSRQLTAEFVQHWRQANPNGKVITRDLSTTPLTVITADWIGAAYTPEAALTPQQKQVLAISHELIAELQAADEYVIGVPMHNFSIPAIIKLWIDQIVRVGKTFSYEGGVPAGLLLQKKATFLVASGGVYEQGTPTAAMNFVEPYLRFIFAFVGVTDTTFINAGGTSQLRYGVERGTIVQPALESIRAQFLQVA
jgi:FMN-dependent NADH-azoreductase